MPRKRDGDERDQGGCQHRAQNQVARHMQRADRISEDERSEDVERRLLRGPQQSRQNDLLRLLSDNPDDRRLLDLLVFRSAWNTGDWRMPRRIQRPTPIRTIDSAKGMRQPQVTK